LYSSIVTPDNQKKGKAVGANAQISKPELHRIVEWADRLILESKASQNKPKAMKPVLPTTNTARVPSPQHSEICDSTLWQTFRHELSDNVGRLRGLLETNHSGPASAEVCNQVFRIVHSIKSAAAVLPQSVIGELAQQIEDLLEPARKSGQNMPWKSLQIFTDWLGSLTTSNDVAAVLAQGALLTDDIATAAQ
jgi:HPt (histidine-containing phosphotransfer) domain-containing protein